MYNKNPSIFIFENMSWLEVLTYFRKYNYIISGGKSTERHILTKSRYLLSIFLNALAGINNSPTLVGKSKITNIYKYNNKDLVKYLKSNIDLTSVKITDQVIEENLNHYEQEYDVSKAKELQKEINKFYTKDLFMFIDVLYEILNSNISKNDLSIFMDQIKKKIKKINKILLILLIKWLIKI